MLGILLWLSYINNMGIYLRWFFKTVLLYTILCVSVFLMLRTSINYLSFQDDNQFLAFKQDYIGNPVWKLAFYIHVFSAFIALFAGFTQFSTEIMQKHRKVHRILGHFYIWNILIINFPSALIMAIYANGGSVGKAAFLLLDLLWFWFTYKAFVSALKGKFVEHREFMIRSFALTFSAITLRIWKMFLVQTPWFDSSNVYVVVAWMGFVPNLLLAEVMIRFPNEKTGLRQLLTNLKK